LRERFLGGSNKFFCLRAMFAYGDYASMHVCDEVGLAPIFLALSADGFAQRVFRFSQVVDGPLRYGASNRLETMAHSRDRS